MNQEQSQSRVWTQSELSGWSCIWSEAHFWTNQGSQPTGYNTAATYIEDYMYRVGRVEQEEGTFCRRSKNDIKQNTGIYLIEKKSEEGRRQEKMARWVSWIFRNNWFQFQGSNTLLHFKEKLLYSGTLFDRYINQWQRVKHLVYRAMLNYQCSLCFCYILSTLLDFGIWGGSCKDV